MRDKLLLSLGVAYDRCGLMEDRGAASGRRSSSLGRAEERDFLEGLLADVRRGESRCLVVRGEAGIGKTALLEYLIASASDMTVLRAVGIESDMELAYASLHQLCGPILDRLVRLPDPQREAVEIVFGVRAGPPPDRFLVGLGVLSLFSEVAEERPLLCVVDDAQWLDQASALTLAFEARRLLAERVGIVFAAREPGEALEHLPEMELRGLRNDDARALLGTAVPFILDEGVRKRVVAETRGNPLALLELPRGLTAAELAIGFGLVDPQALPERIEESFARRLVGLPEDARLLLLLAAAEPVGDPVLLWRAAARLAIEPRAADHAANEGLLAIGERVTFRHPLVRSAVYRSATAEDRRAAHLALAQATDREIDPDRRAWHLAAATAGPDEGVAVELERSAARAQARGGMAAAAAFLQRAVALTHDPAQRPNRALAATQAHLQAGAFDAALGLLASAEAAALDELGHARVALLRGQIAFASSYGGEASALLLEAARRIEPLDPELARETYLDAWIAAFFAGRFARAGTIHEVSRAALSAPQPSSPPRPSDLLLGCLCDVVIDGRTAAAPKLIRATHAFAEEVLDVADGLRWGWVAAIAAIMLWDDESWHRMVVRQVQSVRDVGLLAQLPISLHSLGLLATWRGDFDAAASLIAEADAIAEATGTRLTRYAALLLAALRGEESEASALIEVEMRNGSAVGQGLGIEYCRWVLAILYNGLGRYEQALTEAQQASNEAHELFVSAWALPELIEAAARTGKTRVAGDALDRLVEATSIGDSDWGLGVLARSRALVSEGDEAEGCYREAIERLTRTRLRPELARAHLLHGEWLRRENRRRDARAQLRTAYELFTTIGMNAFAERTRRELAATGEHVHRRTAETRDDLTAQERQVALLARDGMSNIEIGAQLFLSQHTVAYHLRKVFSKLGISSRRELAGALPGSGSELVSV